MAAFGYEKEGFKFRKNNFNPEIEVMALSSRKIDQCVEYIKLNNIQGIEINSFYGCYKADNLELLSKLVDCDIKVIELINDYKDISIINKFKKLEQLTLSENKTSIIDFNNFPKLKSLSLDDNKNFINIGNLKNLEKFGIGTLNKTSKINFSNLNYLKELYIIKGNIENLNFLQNLNLNKLSVSFCNKLKDISEINGLNNYLTNLEFEHCKNIEDIETVGNLENVEWLKLSNLGEIKSLSFIKKMKSLRKISFVGTNILDGDLSYCVGLEFVGFDNKKHYSHKYESLAPLK